MFVALEIVKRVREMGALKQEGVIKGYPYQSVGYSVWNPTKVKVYNVRSHFSNFFEDSKLGWWKKDEGGDVNFEEEGMYFPTLQRGARVWGGEIDGGKDEGAKIIALIEDNGDDEDGGDGGGGGDDGSEHGDDAPV